MVQEAQSANSDKLALSKVVSVPAVHEKGDVFT